MGTAILKLLFMLLFVGGLNAAFKDWKHRSRYKNTNPEIVKYDSLVTAEIDSLITTTKAEVC